VTLEHKCQIGSIEIGVKFGWRISEGKRAQDRVGVNGKIILKWILNKIGESLLDSSGLE
jgi:hypothetical protein